VTPVTPVTSFPGGHRWNDGGLDAQGRGGPVRTWVDGTLVDARTAAVRVDDHGLTVGDGVFETAKVVRGVPFALTRHLDRLTASARGLGLPDPDHERIRAAVAAVLAGAEDAVADAGGSKDAAPADELRRLRITYTAGPGPLGSDRGTSGPTLIVAAATAKPWPATTAVATVPWTRNERSATAGLKTTSYAENVVALTYAKARGASEAVLGNTRGELCEGTGTNVFVVLDGELVTPPLSSGALAGVTRALVLEWVGAVERELPLDVLGQAEEIFLTSSTRDVQPVHAVDSRQLVDVPGPVTRRAMMVFAERSAADVDP
jgi:branched-chain amino acid aminotransferase